MKKISTKNSRENFFFLDKKFLAKNEKNFEKFFSRKIFFFSTFFLLSKKSRENRGIDELLEKKCNPNSDVGICLFSHFH